jgi:hypothetical protein
VAHPGHGYRGVETAREGNSDALADREGGENFRHAPSLGADGLRLVAGTRGLNLIPFRCQQNAPGKFSKPSYLRLLFSLKIFTFTGSPTRKWLLAHDTKDSSCKEEESRETRLQRTGRWLGKRQVMAAAAANKM